MRLTTSIILTTLLFMWLTWPNTGQTATRPAPARLHTAANREHPPRRGTPAKQAWIICRIFPNNACHKAINIAYCESTLNPHATNGEYRGIFQLGAPERRRYGHGRTTWKQTRAAYAYYKNAGFNPWSCNG